MQIITERQRSVIAFALRRFMESAHNRAVAAGQDKDGRYFKPGAVTAFLTDAGDAEDLLRLMRAGPLLVPAHGTTAWDGKCALGHCGSPSGCETDNRCRANA